MKRLVWVFALAVLVAPMAGAQPREDLGPAGPGAAPTGRPGPTWEAPQAVLFDNGPLVNSPGTGPGGADESLVRDVTVGLTSRGFNHSLAGGFRVADDFTVTGAGWNVSSITFFPYMGNSPTSPSPISGVNLQIWNGTPGQPGSSVVFGDTTTNRLTSSSFANMYRRLESQPTDASRAVMTAVTAAVTTLAPGTYWLDWQVDGNVSYTGPWAPPVTIDGQTTTGNALQSVASTWQPVVDAALQTALGLPFLIEGTPVGTDLAITKTCASGPSPVTCTLSVENLGSAPALNVVVTDVLSAGLSLSGSTCVTSAVGQTVTWTIGTLAAAAVQTCDLQIAGATSGNYGNTATVTSDTADPVSTNNTATTTFSLIASVLEIPALGPGGLALLAILLGMLSVLALRRRASA